MTLNIVLKLDNLKDWKRYTMLTLMEKKKKKVRALVYISNEIS